MNRMRRQVDSGLNLCLWRIDKMMCTEKFRSTGLYFFHFIVSNSRKINIG